MQAPLESAGIWAGHPWNEPHNDPVRPLGLGPLVDPSDRCVLRVGWGSPHRAAARPLFGPGGGASPTLQRGRAAMDDV